MVQEDQLTAVLSEFARTMVTDFPIQGILDRLVERIVDVMPIDAAGVTLISEGLAPHFIAASSDSALSFERLQTSMGQGPRQRAHESGAAVVIPDLRLEDRFPLFAPAARPAGLAAVFAFPLRHGHDRLGALDLYRDSAGPLTDRDLAAAQTLADVTSAYLINARAREEAQETSDSLRRSSLYDALTGLPNRLLLEQRLEHAALRARRSLSYAGVLFIDLDNFKRVNDAHGHHVGDELLRAVARRLSGLIRPGDTLARVYGDEFVFLCEDMKSVADIEALAGRVVAAFRAPFVLQGVDSLEVAMGASVGLAYAGPGADVSDDLVNNADIAMYQAKRKGGGSHHIVDLAETRGSRDRDALWRDLREAFAQGTLDLAYQPIVRTSSGVVTGAEAFLRWNDRHRGVVPARTTVGVAEHHGLITEIGAWVLERACTDRASWLEQHPDTPLDLSVNVSGRQLMDTGFAATVADILNRTSMDPAALVLEMTEGVFIQDAQRAMVVLADLHALGVRLALDDFGTGYSSLSYLRRFPVNIVKIDRGFIADMANQPSGRAIVGAVTNLAHALGLSVTAEGIETQVEWDEITAIGCENAQGYLYARPMPSAELAATVGANQGRSLHQPTVVRRSALPVAEPQTRRVISEGSLGR